MAFNTSISTLHAKVLLQARVLMAIFILFGGATCLMAGDTKRSAVVTDRSNVETEITEIYVDTKSSREYFNDSWKSIIVDTKVCLYAIPHECVSAITASSKEGEYTIAYKWLGNDKKLTGKLEGQISGKSDLGGFDLAMNKLKEVAFTPSKMEKSLRETACEDAKKKGWSEDIILEDKSKIKSVNTMGTYTYYSTVGYIVGGTTIRNHRTPSYVITRGESTVRIENDKIQKVEFDGKGDFTLTLKTGKITKGSKPPYDGYTGFDDNGEFFVRQSQVQIIEFGIKADSK